ncbi:ABC transporter ATP-binding protein [uncultured Brevibacillus sp.]|uniref:ABC transporter ATP-binding protein n=1 Tax=uncultured Brevibacillus sp. TaxID=169970 RepID=UPI002595E340|nr:ABC transporter ATP-binding protein [uncultured Brevibacillus sp.]
MTTQSGETPLLEVQDLCVSFVQYTSCLRQSTLQVINNLSVSIYPGEIVAVVGSSGSGKSLLAHAVLGILPGNASFSGVISYDGQALSPKRQAELRGREIALIPQSVNYLDPLMRVGKQVQTSVHAGNPRSRQREVFERYQLSPDVDKLFPFQLSGGMARRVLVSTALVSGARLVIADEPTPGLDDAAVAETLDYFRDLADQGCGVMLITHDIEAALKIADRIAVFYAGSTVEIAPVQDFAGEGEALRHPYTKALWRALPQNGFEPMPGSQPLPHELPAGCVFQPRCRQATSECSTERPAMRTVREGMVRCIHAT